MSRKNKFRIWWEDEHRYATREEHLLLTEQGTVCKLFDGIIIDVSTYAVVEFISGLCNKNNKEL